MTLPRVLDPCCGSKMMWFDKGNPDAMFGDIRSEKHVLCDGRLLHITPDVIMDFRRIPFADESFHLVVFDPPHLVSAGESSWMRLKYGMLSAEWQSDLRQGFAECFRVLKPNGTLVFKWSEDQVPLRKVLVLTPVAPLFGNRSSGSKSKTHFLVFMKPENTNE